MKKLFMLLAMVGLAAASCTPNGEGPGNNGGGSNEFTIEVSNITESGATVKVTPKDMERTYFWGTTKYVYIMEEGGYAAWMETIHEQCKEMVDGGYESWLGGENPLLVSGVDEGTYQELAPDTKYVVYVFGIDANGNLTSTNLTHKEFVTLQSTFDTSVWAGIWNVTAPEQVYKEQLTSESYISGILPVEEPYTRPVEIVDGESTFGPEDAGYVYIYGWDAAFPVLLSHATEEDIFFPAVGVYANNTIEFLIDEIVYKQQGLYFQWITLCDIEGEMGRVGGNYPPYTFVMDPEGNVTVKAYSGQLTTGQKFDVALHTLYGFEGEGENPDVYPGIAYNPAIYESEEAIYHFSGKTLTAVKVDAGATPAPAKLSAKKNAKKDFRVMHKFAYSASAAREFSSAVKFAR